MKFKFVQRGFKNTLVLLPGWACDWRIFSHLDVNCNYIYALVNNVTSVEIAQYLDYQKINKVSLLGFSMGSFIAADFADTYTKFVKTLVLASTALKPDRNLMNSIKLKIKTNKKAFLYRFYLSCFAKSDPGGLSLFRQELIDDYLKIADKDELIRGLDYLGSVALSVDGINRAEKAIVYHGSEDRVFPLEGILPLKELCSKCDLRVLEGTGHTLLSNPRFLNEMRELWKK